MAPSELLALRAGLENSRLFCPAITLRGRWRAGPDGALRFNGSADAGAMVSNGTIRGTSRELNNEG